MVPFPMPVPLRIGKIGNNGKIEDAEAPVPVASSRPAALVARSKVPI
jgi:hypothetical protein